MPRSRPRSLDRSWRPGHPILGVSVWRMALTDRTMTLSAIAPGRARGGDRMPDTPVVSVSTGALRGSQQDGIDRYLGIPYAAPPFGERRFLPPRRSSTMAGRAGCDRLRPDGAAAALSGRHAEVPRDGRGARRRHPHRERVDAGHAGPRRAPAGAGVRPRRCAHPRLDGAAVLRRHHVRASRHRVRDVAVSPRAGGLRGARRRAAEPRRARPAGGAALGASRDRRASAATPPASP